MRCAPRRTSAASTALLWPPRSAPLTTSQSLKRRSNRPSASRAAEPATRASAPRARHSPQPGWLRSSSVAELSTPRKAPLRSRSARMMADGRFDLRFKLWDVVKGADLGGQSNAVEAAEVRLGAHRIADFVYEKLTGEKGVFSTRIAYVTRAGSRHTLRVADADGVNDQVALNSGQPIISPAWSPNGKELAYVSFEKQKAVVFVHIVATGERRLPRLEQRPRLVERRPDPGGHALARRRLAALLHRQERREPAPHHH